MDELDKEILEAPVYQGKTLGDNLQEDRDSQIRIMWASPMEAMDGPSLGDQVMESLIAEAKERRRQKIRAILALPKKIGRYLLATLLALVAVTIDLGIAYVIFLLLSSLGTLGMWIGWAVLVPAILLSPLLLIATFVGGLGLTEPTAKA